MSRITASTPSGYATTVTLTRVYNLQYAGDALTITATKSGGGAPTATSYEVRDHTGTVVKTGSWSGTSVTIGTAGVAPFDKLDWYTFKLIGTDVGDSAFTTDRGTCRFQIAEDIAFIPKAPLRASNPSYVTDGLDAPLAHGLFSLGGFRVSSLAQNIQSNRQRSTGHAVAATSVGATLDTYGSTTNSVLLLVHVVVGDDTGAAGPGAGWTLDGTGTRGSGASKVSVRIYRAYGGFALASTFTCTTTNAANHSLYLTEFGPYMLNQAPLAIQFFTGNGSTVAITKDMTSLATYEYEILTGVAANAGISSVSESSTPALSPAFGVGDMPAGTQDSFGIATNHSITYTLASTADYVGFVVAYAGDPGGFGAYGAAGAQAAIDVRWTCWGQYQDSNRPYRQITVATLGQTSANEVSDYSTKIAQIVSDTYAHQPGFVGCYTGRNEPQGGYTIGENTIFAAAVRAGNASATPGGPGYVTLGFGSTAQPDLFALCDAGMYGPGGLGALTYHDYNMSNGDIANTLVILRALKAGLVSRGLTGVPIYMTEGAQDTTYYPGFVRVRQGGTAYMLNMVARELILGCPYEHQFYYYDRRGGFDDVTSWQLSDGGPMLGYAMHRAYAREVYGKTVESELDFGSLAPICLGGVWRNPTDKTAVLALIGVQGLPVMTFGLAASSGATIPATLTAVDCLGNTSTVTVTNNSFTLTPSDEIQYVRLPANINAAARPVRRGINFLTLPSVAGANLTIADSGDGSATVSRLGRVNDGSLVSPYAYDSSDLTGTGNVYATATATFPRTVSLGFNFGLTLPPDTLAVYCPAAWQAMGVPTQGKLQYTTDGTNWIDASSWGPLTTVTVKNYDLYNDTMADAYTEPQHYFEAALGSTQAIKGFRLLVTSASNGMYLDAMMLQPTGSVNAGGLGASTVVGEMYVWNEAANGLHPAMRG